MNQQGNFLRIPLEKRLVQNPRLYTSGLRELPRPPDDQYAQFVSALAHEVRNPLTNINLSADMLLEAIKDDDLRMYLDIIRRSSIRINDLFTAFLKYQEAEKMPAEACSIHQLLEEVLETTSDRIALKHIVVHKAYGAEDFKTVIHKIEIKIALTNIVINAIEAMIPGKGELKLITSVADDKYILRIEDNGCGISKENLKNIFKPYFTNRPGGLGLGLSTGFHALRSNHISVSVESEENKGTSFILFFPQ